MDDDSNMVYIARIDGTAYEMGYAYGQLFKEELAKQLKNLEYMYPQIAHDVLSDYIPEEYL